MNKAILGEFKFEPIKFLTSAFRPGGLNLNPFTWSAEVAKTTPSSISTIPPLATGTPNTTLTNIEKAWGLDAFAPSMLEPAVITSLDDISLKLEPTMPSYATIQDIGLKVPIQEFNTAWYRVTENLPLNTATPNVPSGKSFFNQIADVFKWGADHFIKYQQSKQSMDYATSMAKVEAESYKAQAAVAEAQGRIAQAEASRIAYEEGIGKYLSADALKKAAPYLIPAAIALAAIMFLSTREKDAKSKKRKS